MKPGTSLVILSTLAFSLPAASAADGPAPQPAQLVPLSSVRLPDGPFADAVRVNRACLLALDPDRLLAPFLREAATFDVIPVGEQQSEVEHGFAGENTDTGMREGRRWRRGQWFQYHLDTRGEKRVDVAVTYWGEERNKSFVIRANGVQIGSEALDAPKPGQFLEKRYPVPAEVLDATSGDRITVRFSAQSGSWVAGVHDLRLMKEGVP